MEAKLERSSSASVREIRASPSGPVSRGASRLRIARGTLRLLLAGWFSIYIAASATAQDWGSEDDGWSQPTTQSDSPQPGVGWANKAGIGFTRDPNTLLLYFEVPYSFDQWVSLGPAIQIGIDDKNTFVAPTANLTVSVPIFKRARPFISTGIGFAYIAEDNRPGDDGEAGFLINSAIGIEFQLSQRLAVGSQMIFNIFPNKTLGESFVYSWQIGGVRISF